MALLFHSDELRELMKDFYVLTGIGVSIFDENRKHLASYPDDELHFCYYMKKNPEFLSKCDECDQKAFDRCKQGKDVHIYTCHAGLVEAIVAMVEGGKIIGYMMFGKVANTKDKKDFLQSVIDKCAHYEIPEEAMEAIKKIKYRNDKQIKAAARFLAIFTEYLKLNEIVHPSGRKIIDLIDKYIDMHISEEITVDKICNDLNMSRTKLYEITRPYVHVGIAAYVKHKKLEYAKNLIRTTDMPISKISDLAGFTDYNYFLRVFKQKYGISTRKMRSNKDE